MRCKARSAAIPVGIASIRNAAAGPSRVDSGGAISVIQWTRSNMARVAVVDYGMGNLRSVTRARCPAAQGSDATVVLTADPQELLAAERVVLPGQGAMPDCMRELRD